MKLKFEKQIFVNEDITFLLCKCFLIFNNEEKELCNDIFQHIHRNIQIEDLTDSIFLDLISPSFFYEQGIAYSEQALRRWMDLKTIEIKQIKDSILKNKLNSTIETIFSEEF